MTATPTDVLRAHRHLYEVMANPNPNVVRFYDDFFTRTTERAVGGSLEVQAAWVSMLYPARSGSEFLAMLRRPLYASPSYRVSEKIVDVVSDIYERSTQDARLQEGDLPSPTGFIWLDKPLFLTDAGGARIGTRAFSWGPQPTYSGEFDLGDGIRLTSWCSADDVDDFTDVVAAGLLVSYDMRLSISHSQFIPLGGRLHTRDKTADVVPDDVTRWLHTLWVFMGTEIVQSEPVWVGRPERRRARASIDTDTVREVLLRRIRRDGEGEIAHRDVDWTCQWVVQSHFRHLGDYSAVAEHHHAVPIDKDREHCAVCGTRITRVKAYVKGPEGLPLKPVPETVYRVTR